MLLNEFSRMLRAALLSTLVSAGIAGGWFAFGRIADRRRDKGIADKNGPRFELLLQ